MKLLKTSVAAALAMACVAPAMAANVDVYGKANLGLRYADEGGKDGGFTDVKSYASRFGVKGDADLGGKLKAVYKMEFEVDMSDKKDSSDDHIKGRNQYVGLKGGFGTFLLGRNDSMLKQSQGKVDLYSDHEGDIKTLWEGENRLSNSLTYKSPKFGFAQFGVSYKTEGSAKKEDKDGWSLALMLGDAKLKKEMFYAALAYDMDIDGFDIIRATGYMKFGGFRFGLGVQREEIAEVPAGAKSEDFMGYLVNGQYSFGDIALNLQLQSTEAFDGTGKEIDPLMVTAGLDYKLGKMTKARAYWTMLDADTDGSDDDKDYFAFALVHKF